MGGVRRRVIYAMPAMISVASDGLDYATDVRSAHHFQISAAHDGGACSKGTAGAATAQGPAGGGWTHPGLYAAA